MLKVYLGENTKNIYGANAEQYIWGEKGLPIVYSPEKATCYVQLIQNW